MARTNNGILDTGVKLVRNVGGFTFGSGALDDVASHVNVRRAQASRQGHDSRAVYLLDRFFAGRPDIVGRLGATAADRVEYVDTREEPKTDGIDAQVARLLDAGHAKPATIVALGGGSTLDTAKAVANLLTNGGKAEHYQGWDLVKVPGVHKIGVPTLSGTGAEASRTCVMTNTRNGLKLGMNSDYTVFDQLILDPDLSGTVPRDQYFYTGMDAYIHCIESTAGSYRNAIGDAYARETLALCRQVFGSGDMQSPQCRERLMVASYLGGCAIAASYVGVVHPFSAGLSVVLGLHHCVANCIALAGLGEFYPEACDEFLEMADRQSVTIPRGVCAGLSEDRLLALHDATIIHEKPLTNALGEDFRKILTAGKVVSLFQKM